MNWRNVRLIFLREVRDQLRDRRTLFMVAVLPLLLYPALGMGMVQLTLLFSEQPRTVVLMGSRHLPQPPLLDGERFARTWFRNESNAAKLRVVTDEPLSESDAAQKSTTERARIERHLDHARKLKNELTGQRSLEQRITEAERSMVEARERAERTELGSDARMSAIIAFQQAEEHLRKLNATAREGREVLSRSFAAGEAQVVVFVPDDFGRRIEELRGRLRNPRPPTAPGDTPPSPVSPATEESYPRPEIVYNKADDKSLLAYNRVRNVLEVWEKEIVRSQLQSAQLPSDLPHPVEPVSTDLATDTQSAASVWAKLFPALLVIMAVTGAFYPAIDLCAGEKERGTMETLLICPASRTEIVLGKFFTVMTFSSATALLNILSMGFTGQHMIANAPRGLLDKAGDLSLPSLPALLWVVLLLVPLASLFSALSLALATFARSSKEGQYYLTPLLMVTLGLTVFCLSPGVELKPIYSVTPVVGVALLLKGVLLAPFNAGALYWYAIPVLVTSFGYSALALWWAIDQFNREEVLFREAERLDVSLWVRHLLRDKEPTPSFTEAGFCFVLIMLLQFVAWKALARSSLQDIGGPFPATFKALLIQQLAIIACPALMMGIMLTTNLRRTFRLYLPDPKVLAAACVLPVALHPLAVELQASLSWFFEPMPDEFQEALKRLTDANLPWWSMFLVLAAAPAVCEELAFRGFILSGFNRHQRTWLAIALSSIAFGGMHMIPQQVFNATLMGVVLGMIALKSNSLIPCILFHLLNNSLGLLNGLWSESLREAPEQWTWFAQSQDGAVRYTGTTLLAAAAVALPLLVWLARGLNRSSVPVHTESTEFPSAPVGHTIPAPKTLVH